MIYKMLLRGAALAVVIYPVQANTVTLQATITGAGGPGRCKIEVSVDGRAEIEVAGDTGTLTTLSGRPAFWRRFQCNAPTPRLPDDFRVERIRGRGMVRLLRDPRSSRGVTLIEVNDRQGGRADYAIELQWRGRGDGGWMPQPAAPPALGPPGPGPWDPTQRLVRMCQDSVIDRLNRDGYRDVTFERTVPENKPGRKDRVSGMVSGKGRFQSNRFWFSCSVDFQAGSLRSVDVRPQ